MELTGIEYHALLYSALCHLERKKDEIDGMNVFPVPDGDTGTNMCLTLSAVARIEPTAPIGDVAERIAKGALSEARGNSGAILSLFLRGAAKALKGKSTASAALLAEAFSSGADEAYRAVSSPKEGTVLTVMRATAVALKKAVKRNAATSKNEFLKIATENALAALKQTPKLLPVLKEAGVLDAGGYGFYLCLKGMLYSLEKKEELWEEPLSTSPARVLKAEEILYPYCTECSVELSLPSFDEGEARGHLSPLGDSLVLIKDEGTLKLHIHTAAPDKVLSYVLSLGTLQAVKVENMQKQHEDMLQKAESKRYGFVAISSGEGIKEAFRSLGADAVVDGGDTMNPSAQSIANAARTVAADTVFILPNSKNLRLTAERAAEDLSPRRTVVIPTESVPEGLSAMLAATEEGEEALEVRMERARRSVSSMAVAAAARSSTVKGKKIEKGEFLGLVEGQIACAKKSRLACLNELSRGMTGASFVTIFYGKGVAKEEAERAGASIKAKINNDCEVNLLYGGQPIYDYIASVEYK